jgi:hypothetical protein
MTTKTPDAPRSAILPTDPFEITLAGLLGHPDGAHTQPAVQQDVDFYGNATSFIVQTVKWVQGTTIFIQQVNAQGSARYALPPKVVQLLLRQQDAVTHIVRRRHGKRLAEERKVNGVQPVFTPAMRAKALKTRKANAAKKAARRARRAVA